jgi:serine/threonine-protein kinase HipA
MTSGTTMIKVWSDSHAAGLLGPRAERGSTFAYQLPTDDARAVSLTMPVRLESWDTAFGLPPIFEMNLPEGALRERLRLAFAKTTGSFTDFDLLSIVGRSQVGRLRYTGPGEPLDEEVPFQSVQEILAGRKGGALFQYLIERFAPVSGVSGVQPKLLIRDGAAVEHSTVMERESVRGATHIVKFWESEYPELAANEYFCLRAAERCGLTVPRFQLADDGSALVVDRFDLRDDGTYRGLEDFCVLNARQTADKYRGSYETAVLKRFRQFATEDQIGVGSEKLFTLIALNCAVRNGDAHLKNFGVTYDNPEGQIALAPVYDVVTTTAYIPVDTMALTMDGSKDWPSVDQLRAFGETRQIASPVRIREILDRICAALTDTIVEIEAYARERPQFKDIGDRMIASWHEGMPRIGLNAAP